MEKKRTEADKAERWPAGFKMGEPVRCAKPEAGSHGRTEVRGIDHELGAIRDALYGRTSPTSATVALKDPELAECRELNADEVAEATREAATRALGLAKDALGLSRVELRWFAHCDAVDHRELKELALPDRPVTWWWKSWYSGLVEEDHLIPQRVIWIKTTSDPREIFGVVAHECRHLWQIRHWPSAKRWDGSSAEKDAYAYQDQALAWYDRNTKGRE